MNKTFIILEFDQVYVEAENDDSSSRSNRQALFIESQNRSNRQRLSQQQQQMFVHWLPEEDDDKAKATSFFDNSSCANTKYWVESDLKIKPFGVFSDRRKRYV